MDFLKIAKHYLCLEKRKRNGILVPTICRGHKSFGAKTAKTRKHYKILPKTKNDTFLKMVFGMGENWVLLPVFWKNRALLKTFVL